jgi:putative membrane protein
MRGTLVLGAAALILLACRGSQRTTTAGAATSATVEATSPGAVASPEATTGLVAASMRSDANVAAVLHEIHAAEVSAARLAEQRALSNDIKGYARRMVDEHTSLEAQARELARFAGITPELPDSTLAVLQREELAALARQSGSAFDRAFIAQQVDAHQRALTLTRAAMRLARDDQLRTMLSAVLEPRLRDHLVAAETLRARGALR